MLVGIDMVEIERFKHSLKNEHFIHRVFSKKEIDCCPHRLISLAGNFAVKEALVKALGTGMRGITFRDIEVLRDELGKPYVNLSDKIKEKVVLVYGKK